MRRLIAFTIALWSAAPLHVLAGPLQRAMLAARVNGSAAGEVLVLVGDEHEVWIDADGLARSGVHTIFGQRMRVDDVVYVSLPTLAPDVRFELDLAQLELRLTVAPALLGKTVIGPSSRPNSEAAVGRAPAAFLNYAMNWHGQRTASLFAETGLSAAGAVLTTTMYNGTSGRFVRGMTQAVVDDTRRLNRWTIGDRLVSAGELGGAVMLGGVVFAREYGIDPSVIRYPTVSAAGAVSAPAIVEVYANGRLVQRNDIAPGQFELKALPVSEGRGVTRVVVRDVFGREQEFTAPYYLSTALLAKGRQEYLYATGWERREPGTENWYYGRLVAIARHRVGISDTFTAGYRFERGEHALSGGPILGWRFPVGELELGAAASRTPDATIGAAGLLGYRYLSRRLTLGAVFRAAGAGYATVGSRFEERPLREADASASIRVGAASAISVRHVASSRSNLFGGTRSSITVSSRMAGADLFGTITRRQGSGGFSEFVVGFTRAFGRSQGLHVSREATAAGHPSTSAELSRSLPTGTGFGYRAGWRETDHRQMSGLFEYQRQSGRYEAAVTTLEQERTVSFAASGGLVALGRRFYVTRSVQDAFALVRVPGSPGVRVFASHQPIGRTNRRGELFVPSLQPYSTNELSIADDDVPLTSAIDKGERIVVPANRTAAVVEFPVRHVRSALGSIELMTADGIIIPSFGELTVYSAAGRRSSPLGRNGEFYLEDVPPGTYRAVVTSNRRRCEFPLQVPAEGGVPANLGPLRCTTGAER